MKKILLAVITALLIGSCTDAINDLIDELNAGVPICVVQGNTASNPDGRGWANAYPSIEAALTSDRAQDGAEIWVKAGTYTLSTPVTISKSVSIYGGFNGTEQSRIGRSINNNLTIINGSDPNFVSIGSSAIGKVILLDCFTLTGYHIDMTGDGVSGPTMTINNCKFDNISVTSSVDGGALRIVEKASLNISQCSFNNCFAGSGGVIYVNNGASIIMSNSDLSGNHVGPGYSGGAIYAQNDSNIRISNCTFTNNSAAINGGAIYAISNSIVTISNSYFTGNQTSSGNGGGIYNSSTEELKLSNCKFNDNRSGNHGGALYSSSSSGKTTISACTFNGNGTDDGNGGAVCHLTITNLSIVNSWFYDNSAGDGGQGGLGGALYVADGDSHSFVNLAFFGNSAENNGAGIYFDAGSHTVYNSVIYNNPDIGAIRYNIYANTATSSLWYCFYDGGLTGTTIGAGCINSITSPFVSTDENNSYFLYPNETSGVRNSGLSTIPGYTMPATDLAGNPRITGLTVDIGAYEAQ
ncbi:MAG: right-handed parallel beta-helix repeat-containing protein [Spirochaetota bacterium]